MNWEILVGLLSIGIALFFGLRGFASSIGQRLSKIQSNTEPVAEIKFTLVNVDKAITGIEGNIEKVWDIVSAQRFSQSGTIKRELTNLGTIWVNAAPGKDGTWYTVRLSKEVIIEEYYFKIQKQGTDFFDKEIEIFGQETKTAILGSNRLRIYLPSTDADTCVRFMSFLLKWLDSKYIIGLREEIKRFEEPILSED